MCLAAHRQAGLCPGRRLTHWHTAKPLCVQVGQVILNLPNSMAKLSLAGGILTQLGGAALATYTLLLLAALYQEYKRAEVRECE